MSPDPDPEELVDQYSIKRPRGWNSMSKFGKLDFIATRMLAMSRTTKSHRVMKEEGILSVSQMERRRRREVYSKFGSLDAIPPVRGQFSRVYRGK